MHGRHGFPLIRFLRRVQIISGTQVLSRLNIGTVAMLRHVPVDSHFAKHTNKEDEADMLLQQSAFWCTTTNNVSSTRIHMTVPVRNASEFANVAGIARAPTRAPAKEAPKTPPQLQPQAYAHRTMPLPYVEDVFDCTSIADNLRVACLSIDVGLNW